MAATDDLLGTTATDAAAPQATPTPQQSPVRDLLPATPPSPTPPSPAPVPPPSPPPAPPPIAPAPGTTTTPVVSTPVLSQVQGNETVSGQLRELLSQDSPLLKQARDRSQVYAASRGLQNSTLAGQAGEEAVISAATPIAATDAATYANRALVNQQTQNQFGSQQQQFEQQQQLSTQDHVQRLAEQAQAGDINSRLQLEQSGYNLQLSAQENLQRLEQLAKEGDVQSSLALQQFNQQTMLAAQQQGYALDLGNQQFQQNQALMVSEYAQKAGLSQQEAAQEVARLNVVHQNTLDEIAAQAANSGAADTEKWARDLQTGYLNAVTQRQMAQSQEIQTIYSTQGLTSAQQLNAVAHAQQRLTTDLAAIAAYFQQTPGWNAPVTPIESMPVPPAPGSSPTTPGTGVPAGTKVPAPPPAGPIKNRTFLP